MRLHRTLYLYAISLAFPSFLYYLYMFPRFTFPKIFADEYAGLDAAEHIRDGEFERFTGYRAGLGFLLQPFLFFSDDRDYIYRAQQITNCMVLSLAAIICFFTLLNFINIHKAFISTFTAFLFFPAVYSIMRVSTEVWLALATSIAFYLFTSLYIQKSNAKIYASIFVLQFISIVHSRLFILDLTILLIYFTLRIRKKNNSYPMMLFAFIFLLFFAWINRINSVASYEQNFAQSLFGRNTFMPLFENFLQGLAGKLYLLNLESFGLLSISIIFFVRGMVNYFKPIKPTEDPQSIDLKVLILGLIPLLTMLFFAVFFEVLLSADPKWAESKESLVFSSRYVDCMLPPIFAITMACVFNYKIINKRILIKRELFVLFFALGLASFLVVKLGVIISDPMRSPFGFGISKGRPMQLSYLVGSTGLLILFLLLTRVNPKFILVMPITAWLFASTSFGWEYGIENLGWQKNHEISRSANNFLRNSELESPCITLQISDVNNWWSVFNYRYWSEYPVYSNQQRNCILKISDQNDGADYLVKEQQATFMYLTISEGT